LDTPSLVILLTDTDVFDGKPCPLRAVVHLATTPAAPNAVRAEWARAALESSMGFAQDRYGIPRAHMPSRRSAVEDATRTSLEFTLKHAGHRLDVFELVSLVHDPGHDVTPKDGQPG
jgi:hypothetical protein